MIDLASHRHTAPRRPQAGSGRVERLAERIPTMLWPEWSLRFAIPDCQQSNSGVPFPSPYCLSIRGYGCGTRLISFSAQFLNSQCCVCCACCASAACRHARMAVAQPRDGSGGEVPTAPDGCPCRTGHRVGAVARWGWPRPRGCGGVALRRMPDRCQRTGTGAERRRRPPETPGKLPAPTILGQAVRTVPRTAGPAPRKRAEKPARGGISEAVKRRSEPRISMTLTRIESNNGPTTSKLVSDSGVIRLTVTA